MGQFRYVKPPLGPNVSGVVSSRRSNVELNEEVGVIERFDEESGRYIVHLSVGNPSRHSCYSFEFGPKPVRFCWVILKGEPFFHGKNSWHGCMAWLNPPMWFPLESLELRMEDNPGSWKLRISSWWRNQLVGSENFEELQFFGNIISFPTTFVA